MPAIATQVLKIKDSEGREFTITDRDNIVDQQMTVSVVCDSPRHQARFGDNLPLVWSEQAAAKDINSLPDGFFRLIKIQPNPLEQNQAVVFCSRTCAKDWLQYAYQEPRTAKELLADAQKGLEVTAEAQAAIEAANPQMKLPFPEPESDATGATEELNAG